MTCDSILKLIPLYSYGELTPAEEDRVEQHLHECAACAREMKQQRALSLAIDRRHVDVPASLLEDCRGDLMAAIQGGAPGSAPVAKGPWTLFLEAMGATFGNVMRMRQPAGALALIAVGFLAARLMPSGSSMIPSPVSQLSLVPSEDVFSTVRSVQPDPSGHVKIAFDETRRREVSGRMDDANIQRLLLAAAHEENPAVRVESMELLKGRAESSEVRNALLNAALHDLNAGVRYKAVEGLKPFASDPQVRKTMAQVLLTDNNDGVRNLAVDLLVSHRDDAVIGVLQGMMAREDNTSVRLKVEKALKNWNASIGTF